MKYQFVAIERRYASGGKEVAQKLSKGLGIPCYGNEILERAAEKYGTTPEYLERLEEKPTNSLLYSLVAMAKVNTTDHNILSDEDNLYLMEKDVINELAHGGPAVFIGHCSGEILKEKASVLNVFIHSSLEDRKERAVRQYGEELQRAENKMKRNDLRRSHFYSMNTGRKWNDMNNYDLILNTGRLGIDKCVAILKTCME